MGTRNPHSSWPGRYLGTQLRVMGFDLKAFEGFLLTCNLMCLTGAQVGVGGGDPSKSLLHACIPFPRFHVARPQPIPEHETEGLGFRI